MFLFTVSCYCLLLPRTWFLLKIIKAALINVCNVKGLVYSDKATHNFHTTLYVPSSFTALFSLLMQFFLCVCFTTFKLCFRHFLSSNRHLFSVMSEEGCQSSSKLPKYFPQKLIDTEKQSIKQVSSGRHKHILRNASDALSKWAFISCTTNLHS